MQYAFTYLRGILALFLAFFPSRHLSDSRDFLSPPSRPVSTQIESYSKSMVAPSIRFALPRVSLLCLALFLAGCARYHPRPIDPSRSEQAILGRSLNDEGLASFVRQNASGQSVAWPPVVLDRNALTLVAFYYDSDLDLARAKVATAEAEIVTARARPNPSLSTGAGWTNAPESALVFHFDPTFTVETGGKRGWRTLEAQKRAEAARVAVAEMAWRVQSRVRSAWLEYLLAGRLFEISSNERTMRADAVAMLEKRLAVGEASQPEVNVVRTALIAAEVEAKATETQLHESGAALAAAIGLPILPRVDQTTPLNPPSSLPLSDVQKAGILHRADIRRSLLEYAASEAKLHLEIANQYPDLQLNPGYSFDEGHHKIALSPGFMLPVFDRNRGPIAEAEARRAEAEAQFNGLQAQAIGEMEIALARYNGARAELAESEQRLTRIQQVREAAMRRAVQAGEEDRLALNGIRIEGVVAARARLDALRRVESALGALEDAVQQSLEPRPPLADVLSKREKKP